MSINLNTNNTCNMKNLISIEKLTVEYVKIYQKIYMVRQDIFDSLNIFNGKGSIQVSSEQEDFKLIAQTIKKHTNFLKKDMSLVRIFEETLEQCKKILLSYENEYSLIYLKLKNQNQSNNNNNQSQLADKRSILLKYFNILQNEQQSNNNQEEINNTLSYISKQDQEIQINLVH